MPFQSSYHQREFKKCKYCDNEAVRQIMPDGRNKGHLKTCGSVECLKKRYLEPSICAKKSHKGNNHPKWIADRSQVKFRPRYEMTSWTKAVFERDSYTCIQCGQRGGKLQADHIKPYALFPQLRWELSNGRTLCVDCHKKTETYARFFRSMEDYYAIC